MIPNSGICNRCMKEYEITKINEERALYASCKSYSEIWKLEIELAKHHKKFDYENYVRERRKKLGLE